MANDQAASRPSLRPTHLRAVDLSPLRNLRYDLPAGLVTFLVALPLCLGVALASGAPLLSGLIAGVVGGVVVPLISKSSLSVSGPAAGLAAIVAAGVTKVGGFETFGAAVVLGGAIQLLVGVARAGIITSFIPSSVIRGMLSAIGILLILKQIPHALGYDAEAITHDSFAMTDAFSSFGVVGHALSLFEPGAILVSLLSLAVLVIFERVPSLRTFRPLPSALVVVLVGTLANELFLRVSPGLALAASHLVAVPVGRGPTDILSHVEFASFARIFSPDVLTLALTLAIVASLESLLSLDAIDRLDPYKRRSDPNRELVAQGAANMISGLVGGLPITSVIVRSSANVNAGGRTRASAFIHGLLLLLAVAFAGAFLNRIPLAALASILLVTGFKLAKPAIFAEMRELGLQHFVPFTVTIVAIVATDLLRGIIVGIVVGLGFTIRESMRGAFEMIEEEEGVKRLRFLKDIYFFHKASVIDALEQLEEKTLVVVDKGAADFVERDVLEAICDFRSAASTHGVQLDLVGLEPVRTMGAH